jgi:hypothetical protein
MEDRQNVAVQVLKIPLVTPVNKQCLIPDRLLCVGSVVSQPEEFDLASIHDKTHPAKGDVLGRAINDTLPGALCGNPSCISHKALISFDPAQFALGCLEESHDITFS